MEPLLRLATMSSEALALVALQCLSLLLDHPDAFDVICDKEKKTSLSKIVNLSKHSDEQVRINYAVVEPFFPSL